MRSTPLLRLALLLALPLAPVRAQQPNPLGGTQADTAKTQRQPNAGNDSSRGAAAGHRAPAGFEGVDSVEYRLAPSSRLEVKTGKAGLFGFAGHTHVIRARAFSGNVVYYPHAAARSHLQITIQTDSLEVLTPPDTAEIRKVTEAMRTETPAGRPVPRDPAGLEGTDADRARVPPDRRTHAGGSDPGRADRRERRGGS